MPGFCSFVHFFLFQFLACSHLYSGVLFIAYSFGNNVTGAHGQAEDHV